MKNKTIWVLVLSLALGAAFSAAPVRADVTIGVTPSIVDLSGADGSSGEVELTVLNQGDEPFDATISSQPYDRADLDLSVPDWLTVNPSEVHVEVGSQAIVNVSVNIPEGEPSGSRYAGIAIETGSVEEEGTAARVSGRLVVPFLITVEGKGDLTNKAEVGRFAPVLEMDGRLGFRAELTNSGNVHWKTAGKVTVEKEDGSDYGNLDLNQTTIYPGGTALVGTSSTLPVETGASFQASAEVDYGAKKPARAEAEFTFTPELSVSGSACENLDRGPTMTAILDNTGDLGIMANLTMTISSADGQAIARANAPAADIAWPNEVSTIPVDLVDRLPSGDYSLLIEVITGASAEPMSQTIPFSIGGTGPNVAPICEQPTESSPEAA